MLQKSYSRTDGLQQTGRAPHVGAVHGPRNCGSPVLDLLDRVFPRVGMSTCGLPGNTILSLSLGHPG